MEKRFKRNTKTWKIVPIALVLLTLMLFTTMASAVVDVKIEKKEDSVKFIVKNVGNDPVYVLNALTIVSYHGDVIYQSQDPNTAEVLAISPGVEQTFDWDMGAPEGEYKGKLYIGENNTNLKAIYIDFLYMFNWNLIPGVHDVRLIEFLKQKYGIEWVETATITKSIDNSALFLKTENHSLSLELNPDKTMVDVTLDDGRIDELIAKTRDDQLNIYDFLIGKNYLFNWNEVPGDDSVKLQEFLREDYGINWDENSAIEKSDDGTSIKVSTNEYSILLELNNDKTRIRLTINDGRTEGLFVKEKNGELRVFAQKYRKPLLYTDKLIYNELSDVDVTFLNMGLLPINVNVNFWEIKNLDTGKVIKLSRDCTYGYDSSVCEDSWERLMFMESVGQTWDKKYFDMPARYTITAQYTNKDPLPAADMKIKTISSKVFYTKHS